MRASPSLPPLPSLRAFISAARHLSFRKAGEELLISQSAVSHHVAKLEAMLGARLFVRKARGVELTEIGEAYFCEASQAFRQIENATRAVLAHGERPRLRVSVLPSFAANWLVPRLERWRTEHAIDIDIDPTLRAVDLDAGEADIAIRYGSGDWPGLAPILLCQERIAIVASPALIARGPRLDAPQDILKHTLLVNLKPYDWEAWAAACDLDLSGARMLQLTDYNIVLQAALDGQGLAAGRELLIADRLRDGALKRVFPDIATTPGLGYWLLRSKASRQNPDAQAFIDWLTREIAAAPTVSD